MIEAVLTLSGALDEHLLDPAAARAGHRGDRRGARSRRPPARRRASRTPRSRSWCGRWASACACSSSSPSTATASAPPTRSTSATRSRSPRGWRSTCPRSAPASAHRFRVVLLDEYQDTSYAQLTLLGALFGDGHPVTAVGDPHQSIYGWRGASAGGLEGFPTSFPQVHPDGSRSPRRRAPAVDVVAQRRRDPRGRQPRRGAAARRGHPGRGPGARRPARRRRGPRARARRRDGRGRGARGRRVRRRAVAARRPGPGAGHARRCCAASARSSSRCGARCARPGCRSRSSGSAGCCPRPRSSTWSPLLQAAHDPSRGDALMRLLTGARTAARRRRPARARGLVGRARRAATARARRRRRRRSAEVGRGGPRWSSRRTRSTSAASSTRSTRSASCPPRAGPAAAAGR